MVSCRGRGRVRASSYRASVSLYRPLRSIRSGRVRGRLGNAIFCRALHFIENYQVENKILKSFSKRICQRI